jgi:hypothetical protein
VAASGEVVRAQCDVMMAVASEELKARDEAIAMLEKEVSVEEKGEIELCTEVCWCMCCVRVCMGGWRGVMICVHACWEMALLRHKRTQANTHTHTTKHTARWWTWTES